MDPTKAIPVFAIQKQSLFFQKEKQGWILVGRVQIFLGKKISGRVRCNCFPVTLPVHQLASLLQSLA
jgi:hypothetical protein